MAQSLTLLLQHLENDEVSAIALQFTSGSWWRSALNTQDRMALTAAVRKIVEERDELQKIEAGYLK